MSVSCAKSILLRATFTWSEADCRFSSAVRTSESICPRRLSSRSRLCTSLASAWQDSLGFAPAHVEIGFSDQ